MPYTGYDPFGPQDPSGGGLDPSLYYALSPGGRFAGDVQNYLEYLAGQSRGTAGGNEDYDVPDWMTRMGRFGRMLGWHERNVQQGGEGQAPSPPGGYPYQFWSGPGASYGPPGGPLHGLVDQGRMGDPWDGPDRPEGGSPPGGGGGKGGRGGGAPKIDFNWQPYQGMQHQSSFVDWQPTQAFSGSSGPTRFVQGQGSTSVPRPQPPQALPPLGGGGKGGGQGGAGRRGGRGSGRNGQRQSGGGRGGQTNKPPAGGGGSMENFLEWLVSSRGEPNRWGAAPGPGLRDDIRGGVDVGNIDKGTPGWRQDPTTGIWDTRGMPNATPFGPNPGEGFDSYLTRLHDSGLGAEAIGGLLGPYGFHQNDNGDWEQGWGTGPVVRGPEGYQFANQAGGKATIGGGNSGANPGAPNAADMLTGGIFGIPAY